MNRKLGWAVAAVVVAVLGVLGATRAYILMNDRATPDRLTLDSQAPAVIPPAPAPASPTATVAPAPAKAADAGVDGTWRATPASQVGYRVKEILFGQSTEAVGRTNAVTGELVIQGARATQASFTVDMTQVASDQSRRDGQFHGRIMDTASYPTATFVLTSPIDFGSVPAEGAEITATATGNLTLRGTTKPVTFPVKARRQGSAVQVNGSIPITFADWSIPNPSFGSVSTDDHGELEFLLVFARA